MAQLIRIDPDVRADEPVRDASLYPVTGDLASLRLTIVNGETPFLDGSASNPGRARTVVALVAVAPVVVLDVGHWLSVREGSARQRRTAERTRVR